MRKAEVLTLFAYNEWANRRLLRSAHRLSSEVLTARASVSHGSILGSLAHVLAAESMWLKRCQDGESPRALLSVEDFPTFDILSERWESEMAAMHDYLSSLRTDDFQTVISYTNTKGQEFNTPLWQILLHIVNHGTQYRAEAGVLLSQHGASPGDMDLIAFLRERVGTLPGVRGRSVRE